MQRREFLSSAVQATAGLILAPSLLLAQEKPASDSAVVEKKKPVRPPAMNPDLVKEFVTAGHNDFAKVKEMLASDPYFALATWDWGGGDFETALEGAGHMGEKEIANYLIENGARPSVFVLTMLGATEIVKGMIEKYPALLRTRGPHGFTLWHHASKGGAESAELLKYIESKGVTKHHLPLFGEDGKPKG